jgi:DHA1 family multidrug resistance protein-like MFS transporter
MGSAIYTPAIPYIIEIFHTIPVVASLGLALYVLGYGIGPLIFAPLSEVPVIGRNPPYMATFAIFIILCVPTALVNNIGGFLVLRFLQGFFGSPCLATGGASIGDLYSLLYLPYFLSGWAAFATGGPALGPLISGFSVPAENWRWAIWEMLWLSGPIFVLLMFLFPETSGQNILLRRATRLRKLTGNPKLKAQSEIDQEKLSLSEVAIISLWRPFQINFLDPAVAFTSVYVSLVYAIFYSFFEVFPLVYGEGGYNMNSGQLGIIFLCIIVGVSIAIPGYFAFLRFYLEPKMKKFGMGAPEDRLIPALFASFLTPIGLFIFAWTGRPSIHWIVPTIGVTIYTIGIFIIIQCVFVYLSLTYPQYAASLFAGNDFCRSALAAGAVLFARPLFLNLGIAKGVTLLAGLTISGVLGIFILFFYGPALRARSRFAAK